MTCPGCSRSRAPRPTARAAGTGSTRPPAGWPTATRWCSVPGNCTVRTSTGSCSSRTPPPSTVRTSAPRGGVPDGDRVVFRARDLHGPYEHRTVLEQDSSPVNGPHQGALVDDVHGGWWFVHFQDRGVFGRVTHVQPVSFDAEGWPHMGEPVDEVRGRPVAVVPPLAQGSGAPATEADASALPYEEPLRSDDFRAPE